MNILYVGMADEHASRNIDASSTSTTYHDFRHNAGSMFHSLCLSGVLHSSLIPSISGKY